MFRFASLVATFQRLRSERAGRTGRSAIHASLEVRVSRRFGWSLRAAVLGGCVAGLGLGIAAAPAEAAKKDDEWSDWEDENPKGARSGKSGAKIQQAAAEEEADDEEDVPQSDFMGVIGRGGHLGGRTFGRNESISPIEFMPYLMVDDHFFFTDMRGFISNRAQGGGNLGVGYRYLDEPAHAWYGANLFYDVDNSTGYHFQQVGFGLEAMIHQFEFRGNYYAPVGPRQSVLSQFNSNARFAGTQLLFDSFSRTGTAMQGFDVEAGYSLPIDLRGVNDQLRAFAGYYRFTGSGVEDVNGVKVRAELDLSSTVTTNIMFSHDKTFGSRVMAGMQFNLPWGNKNPASDWRRDMPNPFRYVERNYNVIVSQTSRWEEGVVARDANGNAYVVAHVDSNAAGGGAGGVTDPYTTVTAALAGVPGANLVFVHADSVLNEQIALTGGQYLIGEGGGASIAVQGYGTLAMPTLGGGATPIIDGTGLGPGANAITLSGAGNYVGGFGIQNFSGSGVVGNGINGATLQNLSFNGLGGDGIALTGATGTVNLNNLAFDTVGGRGLFVDGGSANVNVNATFDNVTGDGIRVQNTTGGSVRLTDVDITNGGGNGLSLVNLLGDFFSSNLNIDTVAGDGVYINQGSGTMNFAGLTKITDPGARGFVIDTSAADVTVADLNVDPPGGVGVELDHATGEVVISRLTIDAEHDRGLVITDSTDVTIDSGAITTVGHAGVDISNSTVDIALQSVSVDGGPVGIQILNSTGTFYVSGTGTAGSGGTIENTAQAVKIDGFGSFALQRMNITDNILGISSKGADLLSLNNLNVTGTTGGFAVDSMNDELVSIVNSTFSGNGVVGGGTIRIRADAAGTYQSQIINNSITDTVGSAIEYSNSGAGIGASQSITIQNNTINASRDSQEAVDIRWDGPLNVFFAYNDVNLTGSTMIGLNMHELSTTTKLSATVGANRFTMGGINSIAVKAEAEDTSELLMSGNTITMNGGFGQAFWLDLFDAGEVWIHSNTVKDNGGSGRGINIANVGANSRLQIEANTFQFLSGGSTYGIRIENAVEEIQLFGTVSNSISGATTNFIMPSGKGTGSIIINNVTVPAP